MGLVYGLLAAIIWSGFPVITRLGVTESLTPYDITALRFLTAGALLTPYFLYKKLYRLPWPAILILTVGAGAPYILLASSGLQYAPAAHFGVITPSSMLVFTTMGGWLWLHEAPRLGRIAGLSMIIAGIVLIGWEGLRLGDGHDHPFRGDAMFVLAGLMWSSYTLATRVWLTPPLHAIAVVSVFSMVFYLPIYYYRGPFQLLHAGAWEILAQLVFQGVLSALLALFFYTRAVAMLGAGRGAVFGALVPPLALILAYPVLGEIPTALQWLGAGVVTAGMLLALGAHTGGRPAKQN